MLAIFCCAAFRLAGPIDFNARNTPLAKTESVVRVTSSNIYSPGTCRLHVIGEGPNGRLPLFAYVADASGKRLDPTGRGLYSDGRFAVDGEFSVDGAPGLASLTLRPGPDYIPVTLKPALSPGKETTVHVRFTRWFSPEDRGWYGGDNHVHPNHDPSGEIKTDLANAQIQARANGLSFVTDASSEVPFPDHLKLSTSNFLLRRSLEDRQGSFAGHLNSPGIEIPPDDRATTMHAAMPDVAAMDYVHARGAAIIQTHMMVPPHQLHWMGAAGAYSYAVLNRTPDAMDLDGEASEELWFTALNLGNRIACSGSTDAALERAGSPAPGARRMYVHSDKFDYGSFVQNIRKGRVFATNAGPLFAFVTMDGKGIGDALPTGPHSIKIELESLHPLEGAQLVRNGVILEQLPVQGRSGSTILTASFSDSESGWYVVRAQDQMRDWVVTSPVYVTARHPKPRGPASSIVFEIGNFSRLSLVHKNFMAHFIATASADDPLASVELLKDGSVVQGFSPSKGSHAEDGKTPVTETFGDYKPGWLWTPSSNSTRFQADWNVTETGWYQIRLRTNSGRLMTSDEILYDTSNPMSHETSDAVVFGPSLFLRHIGYGEDVALDKIDKGDHWWYSDKTFFHMETRFGTTDWSQTGGDASRQSKSFRLIASLSIPKRTSLELLSAVHLSTGLRFGSRIGLLARTESKQSKSAQRIGSR